MRNRGRGVGLVSQSFSHACLPTCQFDRHGASMELESTQYLHGRVSILGTDHGHEGKSSGLASMGIIHNLDFLNLLIYHRMVTRQPFFWVCFVSKVQEKGAPQDLEENRSRRGGLNEKRKKGAQGNNNNEVSTAQPPSCELKRCHSLHPSSFLSLSLSLSLTHAVSL